MRWFRFGRHGDEYRRRRAYFRPAEPSTLDVMLQPLVNTLVTVHFEKIAASNSPFAGQRLFRIVGPPSTLEFVRPEADFDFLDRG